MEQKPGDLLLGVIEFFGILIPGAALVFLHGNLLLSPLGLSMTSLQTPADWIPAFIVSYILGHFLFALGIETVQESAEIGEGFFEGHDCSPAESAHDMPSSAMSTTTSSAAPANGIAARR